MCVDVVSEHLIWEALRTEGGMRKALEPQVAPHATAITAVCVFITTPYFTLTQCSKLWRFYICEDFILL